LLSANRKHIEEVVMTKPLAIALVLAALFLAGEARSSAADRVAVSAYRLSAKMNTSQVVTPANKPWKAPAGVAKATGTFTGTFDDTTRKLTWRITYTAIGRPALALADIHLGPPGKFGAIIVRLCGPCTSGQKGVRTIKRSFVRAVTSGNSWVTVITNNYPNGVIRGQIKATAR
jgi:hypothetical protein